LTRPHQEPSGPCVGWTSGPRVNVSHRALQLPPVDQPVTLLLVPVPSDVEVGPHVRGVGLSAGRLVVGDLDLRDGSRTPIPQGMSAGGVVASSRAPVLRAKLSAEEPDGLE